MIEIHDYKEGITYWSNGGVNKEEELAFNMLVDSIEQMKKDIELRKRYSEEYKRRLKRIILIKEQNNDKDLLC